MRFYLVYVFAILFLAGMTQTQDSNTQETQSYKILAIDLFGSRSHKNFYMAIAEELGKRNHSVTFLTGIKPSKVNPHVNEVYIQNKNFFNSLNRTFNFSMVDVVKEYISYAHKVCPETLASKELNAVLQERFDLVLLSVITTECFAPILYKMKVPVVYMSPNVIQSSYSSVAGTPFFPSIVGSILFEQNFPPTFYDRMRSTLYDIYAFVLSDLYINPKIEAYCISLKRCPEDVPSYYQLKFNISNLFITNSVRTLEKGAMPYTPTVVHAGGIHCRPAKPLPKDLEEWANGSGDAGFIFFSLGSIVKPSEMSEMYRSMFLKVFGSLKQRVLWKWDEDTMEGLPPNVKLSKWLPQQDVLGHPKLRLFLTHGGLLSLQEATYHGVPVLGFPVFVDQQHNIKSATQEGWGRGQQWDDLTYEALRNNITEIMEDARMKDEVARRSRVMVDQPMSPGDWVSYWIEYVIRHDGALHLRCPAVLMPWYELYNVDVWITMMITVVVVILLILFISYKCLRCVCSRCFGSKKTKQD